MPQNEGNPKEPTTPIMPELSRPDQLNAFLFKNENSRSVRLWADFCRQVDYFYRNEVNPEQYFTVGDRDNFFLICQKAVEHAIGQMIADEDEKARKRKEVEVSMHIPRYGWMRFNTVSVTERMMKGDIQPLVDSDTSNSDYKSKLDRSIEDSSQNL